MKMFLIGALSMLSLSFVSCKTVAPEESKAKDILPLPGTYQVVSVAKIDSNLDKEVKGKTGRRLCFGRVEFDKNKDKNGTNRGLVWSVPLDGTCTMGGHKGFLIDGPVESEWLRPQSASNSPFHQKYMVKYSLPSSKNTETSLQVAVMLWDNFPDRKSSNTEVLEALCSNKKVTDVFWPQDEFDAKFADVCDLSIEGENIKIIMKK